MNRLPDRRDAVGSVPAHHQTCLFALRPDDCALSPETAMLREHVSSKEANGGAFFLVVLMGLARKTACVPARAVVTFVLR
jgi:hypothetical protein